MIKISESEAGDEENLEKSFRSVYFAFPVSWICNGCVRAIGREPIPLEERAVLCGVRLREPLQGVGVRLTLAVRDGDAFSARTTPASPVLSYLDTGFVVWCPSW